MVALGMRYFLILEPLLVFRLTKHATRSLPGRAPEPPQIHVWQLEGFLFETITRHRYVGRLTPRYGVTCGVEKEYLAWPITKRSLVRVQPPQQVRRETGIILC